MLDPTTVIVTRNDGTAVKPGDIVTNFRGEDRVYLGVSRFGRTGTPKVLVMHPDEESSRELNASVYDLSVQPDICPECGTDLRADGYPTGHRSPDTGDECLDMPL